MAKHTFYLPSPRKPATRGRGSLAFSDIKTEIADFGMGMNLALTRAVGFF